MNKLTKIISAVLVLMLLVAAVPAAYAAEYRAEEGTSSVTVTFTFDEIVSIDSAGGLVVTDADGIVASATASGNLGGVNAANEVYFYSADLTPVNYVLSVVVTLKNTASAGDKCTIGLNYNYTDEEFNYITGQSVSHTIVIEAPETTKAPETTPAPETTVPTPLPSPAPETTAPAPETTAPVVTSPITGTPSEPKPPVSSGSVDYTDLKKQISNAEGLEESKYTADSWKNLESALAAAKAALKSDKQSVVDDAAVALSSAIDALVAIDYSALEAAIERVNTFVEDNKVANKATKLMDALVSATELLTSNDQKSIDEAAAQLNTLVDEIEDLINSLSVTETVIKEVEVEVEVEPQDDYCNIKIHYVWPVLFFISLALNLGFIALIVVFVVRRKKNQTDDTPLVDYDIDDAE